MAREQLAIVSAVLTAVCVLPYLRDVHRGTTRPQRASWFVFAFVSVVASVSQLAAGGGAGAWLSAGSAVGFTAVFVTSIRHGVGGWSPVDRVALVIAVAGVIASAIARHAIVAVVAVIVAEVVAIALTVRKAADDPASETASTWMVDLLAGCVAIAAVTQMSVVDLLYPAYHTLANAAVLVAIGLGRSRRRVVVTPVAAPIRVG